VLRVFPLQTVVSLLPRAVCSPFLLNLPPAHLLINPLAEVRIPDLLCSLRTRYSPRVRVIFPRVFISIRSPLYKQTVTLN
jgi:hypothetical protein